MKILNNIISELKRRIDELAAKEDKTEYQKMLGKAYCGVLDFVNSQVGWNKLPRLTLGDVLEGITGNSSWDKTAFEVIGGRNGKVLFRSWNRNNRKLPEQYLDLEISTTGGKYSIEPRVVLRDLNTSSPWRDEKQYLLCYYEITVLNPKGIGD